MNLSSVNPQAPRFTGSFQIKLLDNADQKAIKKNLDATLGPIAQDHQTRIETHTFKTSETFSVTKYMPNGNHTISGDLKTGTEPILYIDTYGQNKTKERAADNAILAAIKKIIGTSTSESLHEAVPKIGRGQDLIECHDSDISFKYSPETKQVDYNAEPQPLW